MALPRPFVELADTARDIGFLGPWFLGSGALEIPPLHASGEAAANAWLRFSSEAWLRLVDEQRGDSTAAYRVHKSGDDAIG